MMPTAAASSEGLTGAGGSSPKMAPSQGVGSPSSHGPLRRLPECPHNMAADSPQNEHPGEKARRKRQYLL